MLDKYFTLTRFPKALRLRFRMSRPQRETITRDASTKTKMLRKVFEITTTPNTYLPPEMPAAVPNYLILVNMSAFEDFILQNKTDYLEGQTEL